MKQTAASFGAYPSVFCNVFGLWVGRDRCTFLSEETNQIIMNGNKEAYSCRFLCDRSDWKKCKAHLELMEVISMQESPVSQVNEYGKGKAYYLEHSRMRGILKDICS